MTSAGSFHVKSLMKLVYFLLLSLWIRTRARGIDQIAVLIDNQSART